MHDLEKAVLGLLLWVLGSNRLESIIPADAKPMHVTNTLLKHDGFTLLSLLVKC